MQQKVEEENFCLGLKESIFSFKSKNKYEIPSLLVEHTKAEVYPDFKASNRKNGNLQS